MSTGASADLLAISSGHLEGLPGGRLQGVLTGVEQMAVRAAQRVGGERRLDGLILDGCGQEGEGALVPRPFGEIAQATPDRP
nr:hypothetical protein [Phenylobacterium sp. J367]